MKSVIQELGCCLDFKNSLIKKESGRHRDRDGSRNCTLCGDEYDSSVVYALCGICWYQDLINFMGSHDKFESLSASDKSTYMYHHHHHHQHHCCHHKEKHVHVHVRVPLGYVLDGVPSPEGEWKSMKEQLQVVQDLDPPPDIIINLKVQFYYLP